MEPMFKGTNAYSYLSHLTDEIGIRLGGTENEKKAADYIESQFKSWGMKTWQESFPIRTYEIQSSKIEALGTSSWEIPHEIVGMSHDTPDAGIEGEIHYIENGVEEHITPAIKDKIVLVFGGTKPKLFSKYIEYGARAVVTIENNLLESPMQIKFLPEVRDRFGSVPTFRIPYLQAVRLFKEGVTRLRLHMKTKEWDSTSQNVIGEIQGTEKPDEIIVVCGHYDTVVKTVGASDNGGGTVIMMELARIFAEKGSKRTLRFIAFGSEEMGLRGSVHYTQQLKEKAHDEKEKDAFDKEKDKTELDQHVFCINIDVQGVLIGSDSCLCIGEPEVNTSVQLLSKEIGKSISVSDSIMSSDNTALSSTGIPSIAFARSGAATGYLHSAKDTLEHLDPIAFEKTGRFIEQYMDRYVANAFAFPFERKVPSKLNDDIQEYFGMQLRKSWLDDPKPKKKE